jgi:hypothetical protein
MSLRDISFFFFGGMFFAGMVGLSPEGENYWMIGLGLLGCALSFIFIRKDS